MCNTGEVEDELHVFNCPAYNIIQIGDATQGGVGRESFYEIMREMSENTQVYIFKALKIREQCKGVGVVNTQ